MIYLGVNIDHVATVRNARGGAEPDPIAAALLAEAYGADGITAHLREDRRHMRDADIYELKQKIKTRLNLEMAVTSEMIRLACDVQPYMVTLVPEKREERTTEGGLEVAANMSGIREAVSQLNACGILVSLFVAPDNWQLAASRETGTDYVELHTGEYANAWSQGKNAYGPHLDALMKAAREAHDLGFKINAGHGLTYDNVKPIVGMPRLVELNIGHSIIARSVFTGLGAAVADMKALLTP